MTLVHAVGEIITDVTLGDVLESIKRARHHGGAFWREITWQIERRVWEFTGHDGWDEFREDTYGDIGAVVPRADRPELVAAWRRSGLTQQQIADTAGVTQATVQRDLNTQMCNEGPEPLTIINARGQQRPGSYCPRSAPDTEPTGEADPVDVAVAEFPELTYYVETDRAADAFQIAEDLRGYDTAERSARRATLRRSIEIDRAKREGTHRPPDLPPTCRTCGQLIRKAT